MSILLTSGCSITHGSELFHPFYHVNNMIDAYPSLIAQDLGLESCNLALPGASNQYIFHSLVDHIRKNQDITAVIVAWTFPDRFYWRHEKRHWFFNSSWACTTENLEDSGNFQKHQNNVCVTTDRKDLLDELLCLHRHLVENYFSIDFYQGYSNQNTQHYSYLLDVLCQSKNIKLVQVDAAKNYNLDIWRFEMLKLGYIPEKRHPNAQEHRIIADYILSNYF